MAEVIPTSFDEFAVEPGAARRGDVLTVCGRAANGDSAALAGMVWVEFDVGGGPEYRKGDLIGADGRFSVGVLAVETGEWSARYEADDRRYAACRSEAIPVEVLAQGQTLPGGGSIKLVRTDFTDAAGWGSLMTAIEREWYENVADVEVVEDPELSGLTAEELMGRLPGGFLPGMLVVADTRTLATEGHELLGLDLRDEPGRQMRFAADVLVQIQVNLDLSNMDFSDFAGSAGPDGVFRGFD